jgi:hypothetical protein
VLPQSGERLDRLSWVEHRWVGEQFFYLGLVGVREFVMLLD